MLKCVHGCGRALRGLYFNNEFATVPKPNTVVGRKCTLYADNAPWWESGKTINTMLKPVEHLLKVVDAI